MNLDLGAGDLALLAATIGPDIDKQASWCLKAIRKALNRQPDSNLVKEHDQDFYPNYPRHEAPGRSRTAYLRARAKVDAGTILRGSAAYSLSVRGKEKKYILLPASWLNGECWDSEYVDEKQGIENNGSSRVDPYFAERSKVRHFLKVGHWSFGGLGPLERGTLIPKSVLIEFASEFAAKGLEIPALAR